MKIQKFSTDKALKADGLFSNQKSKFGLILEGLAMEDDGTYRYIIYGHLVHFTALGDILWTFGIQFVVIWYVFPALVFCSKQNLAILTDSGKTNNISYVGAFQNNLPNLLWNVMRYFEK
jgi:hypothetical protein